ncbi:MAG: putative membrane protein YphA (DoxX/SURF4 family) [Planctomycetota bacterium]|jgi:uncharacterized membrane protein YphA (DoxX/SURF4 family)
MYIFGLTVSSALFLYYGVSCLRSESMRHEFERFGMPRMRLLIGWLEVLGGVGLAIGLFFPALAAAAAFGLAMLMAAVVAARLRQRDSLPETAPALILALVNGLIAVAAIERLT